MSNAAVTAGASPLDHSWAIGSLPCTKPGMNGGRRVLDLSKIIDSGGSILAQLSVHGSDPIAQLWSNGLALAVTAALDMVVRLCFP